jgi:hypothetical protein
MSIHLERFVPAPGWSSGVPGAVELADDVGGQDVALGAGAQAGGHLQQRREGLVQGVAAGCVALGAAGFDLGLGEGVLGP